MPPAIPSTDLFFWPAVKAARSVELRKSAIHLALQIEEGGK